MKKLRFLFALWSAKAARIALRLLGKNASHFPGEVALKICPDFLKYPQKPSMIIGVTGTNGKTTVSNMLTDTLRHCGKKVMNNSLGSNIMQGITTSFVVNSTLFGHSRAEIAVLEIDERSSIRVYPYITPNYLIVTNLFRDSVMRNAHPEYISWIISSSLPKSTKLILNGDDLIASNISPENDRLYFGIDKLDTDVSECINIINDMPICPVCHNKLHYDYRRYHHIGQASCSCGFKSPERNFIGQDVDFENMTMNILDNGQKYKYNLLSNSIFNVYNQIAVSTLLRQLGFEHEKINSEMSKTKIVESRHSETKVGNITIVTQMAKDRNALATSRNFDYISNLPGKKEIILTMNNLIDAKNWSENTCWLYESDFELLNKEEITKIISVDARAEDYCLRALMAGIPKERLACSPTIAESYKYLDYNPGETIYILHGVDTYPLAQKLKNTIIEHVKELQK